MVIEILKIVKWSCVNSRTAVKQKFISVICRAGIAVILLVFDWC